MIDKYEIKFVNGEERLLLYLNFNYEFGMVDIKEAKDKLEKMIKEYINKNKIGFKGTIVTLIVGGVMVGNIALNKDSYNNEINYLMENNTDYVSKLIVDRNELNNDMTEQINIVNEAEEEVIKDIEYHDNIKIDDSKEGIINNNVDNYRWENNNAVINNKDINNTVDRIIENSNNSGATDILEDNSYQEVDDNIYITLNKKDGSVAKIELEEYLVGVVGAEMPALFNIEALKAQAVIARTYALKAQAKGNSLRDNEVNQSYKTEDELRSYWGSNFNDYYNKVRKAVNDTKGEYLTYNGNYIEAVYHSTSNGVTESSSNVWGNYYPYLVSVDSEYDNLNPSYEMNKDLSYDELSKIFGFTVDKETTLEVLNTTSGNRVERIRIGDREYQGTVFRNMLGLRSADFDIDKHGEGIIFTTRGYGHGVGMSQYGANGMAKNGYSYKDILLHYYPGVSINS